MGKPNSGYNCGVTRTASDLPSAYIVEPWQFIFVVAHGTNHGLCLKMIAAHERNLLLFNRTLGSEPLIEVSDYKYLGVTVTSDLNWTKSINYVVSIATKELFF